MKEKVNEWFKWLLIYFVIALVITFGWQGLELLIYGEIQHRVVNDIIGLILLWSVLLNVIFIKAIYISKSERQKYVVLKKDTYNNLHMKNYTEYCNTLKAIEFNCKTVEMIISNTIKNENGEETSTNKFDSIESFAQYMKCFNDMNISYIKEKLEENK